MCHLSIDERSDAFWMADYYKSMASRAWLLREQNLYCDLEIECENKIITAHRIIVASGIEYFRQMLASNMKESVSKKVKLNVSKKFDVNMAFSVSALKQFDRF